MAVQLRETLLSQDTIHDRVRELAGRISRDHEGHEVQVEVTEGDNAEHAYPPGT